MVLFIFFNFFNFFFLNLNETGNRPKTRGGCSGIFPGLGCRHGKF